MNTIARVIRCAPFRAFTACLLLSAVFTVNASGRTLRVGPERNYKTIRAASQAAADGDIILIDAGEYRADVTRWDRNDLVVWAPEGRARLIAGGASEEDKGIWVVDGSNFTADNIEFSGARASDRNGAGVRIRAAGKVTLRNCYFHDNQNGVLGDAEELVVESCVFDHNGAGDGKSHNLYVGGASVTIRYCHIQRAVAGHNIKTRGKTNYILYNRIMDGADGTAAYAVEMPDCGRSYVIGNVIEQGPRTGNENILSYGAESGKGIKEIYVINNTFVNNGPPDGAFIKCRRGTEARVVNNIFYGPGATWVGGNVASSHNYMATSADNYPRFVDASRYDFHLLPEASRSVINAGVSPGVSPTGFDLTPRHEYVYDARSRARPVENALDIGAFELTTPAVPPSTAVVRDLPRPEERPAKLTKNKKTSRSYPARSTKKQASRKPRP